MGADAQHPEDHPDLAAALRTYARLIVDAVPGLVEYLVAHRSGRVHREVMVLLERPLLRHVLAMTGGNQLRAARVLGLNRNTLRKRCRDLKLSVPRARRPARPLGPVGSPPPPPPAIVP